VSENIYRRRGAPDENMNSTADILGKGFDVVLQDKFVESVINIGCLSECPIKTEFWKVYPFPQLPVFNGIAVKVPMRLSFAHYVKNFCFASRRQRFQKEIIAHFYYERGRESSGQIFSFDID
jgi:hypothetical protein